MSRAHIATSTTDPSVSALRHFVAGRGVVDPSEVGPVLIPVPSVFHSLAVQS